MYMIHMYILIHIIYVYMYTYLDTQTYTCFQIQSYCRAGLYTRMSPLVVPSFGVGGPLSPPSGVSAWPCPRQLIRGLRWSVCPSLSVHPGSEPSAPSHVLVRLCCAIGPPCFCARGSPSSVRCPVQLHAGASRRNRSMVPTSLTA